MAPEATRAGGAAPAGTVDGSATAGAAVVPGVWPAVSEGWLVVAGGRVVVVGAAVAPVVDGAAGRVVVLR